jgi:conjugal transfer pilus assembly protein TrbC
VRFSLLLIMVAWLPTCVAAQGAAPPQMPTDQALEQMMQEQRTLTRQMLEKVRPAYAPTAPDLPIPSTLPGVDSDKIIERYSEFKAATERTSEEGLIVLVSLSMPRASLDRLIDQSAKYRIPLVIRGLVGASLKKTSDVIQDIMGKRAAQIQIDPRMFQRFGVKTVPATVVVSKNSERWMAVEGDVSVPYALEKIANSKHPVAPIAQHFLSEMER